MGKLIFILGGARSGKSSFALEIAKKCKRVVFVATAQALDREMVKRIKLHKESRPGHWDTIEEPRNIEAVLKKIKNKYDCVIIDCLTLLISNLILSGLAQEAIKGKINKLMLVFKKINCKVIVVSNEVGFGIVPDNKLGRDFRDMSGKINQIVAKESDRVIFMVAGLPLKIK